MVMTKMFEICLVSVLLSAHLKRLSVPFYADFDICVVIEDNLIYIKYKLKLFWLCMLWVKV